MAVKKEIYRFREGVTPLNETELNNRFFDVDTRVDGIEKKDVAYEEAITELTNTGIERIDEVITPLVDEAQNVVNQANLLVEDLNQLPEDVQAILDYIAEIDPGMTGYFTPDRLKPGDATVTYDQDGRVESITYTVPNGTWKEEYSYNASGNPETVTHKLDNVLQYTITYTYDVEGNVTGWSES